MMRTSEPADRRAPGPVAAATWRLVPRSLINGTPSLYGSGTPASRREPDRPSHARVVAPGRLVGGLTRHVVEPHTSTGSPPSQLPQFRSTPARNGVATRPAQLSRSGPWPAPGGAPLTGLLLRAPAGSAAWQRRSAGADMPETDHGHMIDTARAELKREPKPIMRAAALVDQLQVSVIQKEEPVKLVPRQGTVEAAKGGRLRIGQELHRHPGTIAGPDRRPRCLARIFVPLFPTGRVGVDPRQLHPRGGRPEHRLRVHHCGGGQRADRRALGVVEGQDHHPAAERAQRHPPPATGR
jgi:hypothetical protein